MSSGGPVSWSELAWGEAPALALLVALIVLPLAILACRHTSTRVSIRLVGGAAALSAASFAWGAWITGTRGMEPITAGATWAGMALGWALGALVAWEAWQKPGSATL